MNPHEILVRLWTDGIAVKLANDGSSLVVPAGRLTPSQRELIMTHKAALVELLVSAHATAVILVKTAMEVCDQHGDDESARSEMRQQCTELPPHLQQDLLGHFLGQPKVFTGDQP